jgi:hypothetical protein
MSEEVRCPGCGTNNPVQIALICGFTINGNYWYGILDGPAAFAALVSMAMLIWQLTWIVPATTKQKDGLIRYSAIQGRKQDIELDGVPEAV